ncbi:MAG: hypothetical protein IJ217_03780 [Clostridia bacterium]|nr:hypothetical protein [Clostridia bacterium]
MKRFYFSLLSILLVMFFHSTLSLANFEWRKDYSLTITYEGKEYPTDAEFNVSWGDNLKVNVTPIDNLVFISGYLRYEDFTWSEGDRQVYVALSDFENLYVTIPYSEYDTHPILLLQATWQNDDGSDYTLMNLYYLNYIDRYQYIVPYVYVLHDQVQIDLDEVNKFKIGDELEINAISMHELSVAISKDAEWMKENGFVPNNYGMSYIAYYIDSGPMIYSENPCECIITIPEDFDVDSEHTIRFQAVSAGHNKKMDDGSQIVGDTDWLKIRFTIVE